MKVYIPKTCLLAFVVCAAALSVVADGPSASALALRDAQAKVKKINLREYDEVKALFQKAIGLASNGYDRAQAKIAYAKYEWRCAKDDEPRKWENMQRDAWEEAKSTPSAQRYELLKLDIPGLDWRTEADKIFKEDPKSGHQYYNGLLDHKPSVFSSYDYDLEVSEMALADTNLTINVWAWNDRKATALVFLGREDEAIKWCEERIAALDSKATRAIAEWQARLGSVYARLSARKFEARDPKWARKAMSCYEKALANEDSVDSRKKLAQLALDIGDYACAKANLSALSAREKTPSEWTATRLGDIAYFDGDFETAVKHYSSVKKLDNGEDKLKPANRRYAQALYVLGRYEEALKAVDGMANWMSNSTMNEAYRKSLRKLIAEGKAEDVDELVPERATFNPRKFRLMCYNIRVGAGAETWNQAFKEGELRALPRVARTIREAQADIVCLQEVNQLTWETGGVDEPAYLAQETGLVATYKDKVRRDRGTYGLAMLSPVQPIKTRQIFLPKGNDHVRICLVNEFEDCIVATSHFSGDADIQAKSAALVVKELGSSDKPVIFCGDLNAKPDSETLSQLQKAFKLVSDPMVNTCHSLNPDTCLDYIFVDRAHADAVNATGYCVGKSTASDHLPLWVDIELK